MATTDRIGFDTAASGQVQGDIAGLISRLESLIAERNSQVAQAMADFQADGVSEQYAHVERRWHNAAEQTQQIINLVKTTLGRNDGDAHTALSQARSAVDGIG